MEKRKRDTYRQGIYILLYALIIASGAFLTMVILTVYAGTRDEIVIDDGPLLAKAEPLTGFLGFSPGDPRLEVFTSRNIFQEIVTPVPKPTKAPKPIPTPTPRPLVPDWKLTMIMGEMVGIVDYMNKTTYLKLGQEYGDARIKQILENSIIVESIDINDDRTREIPLHKGGP